MNIGLNQRCVEKFAFRIVDTTFPYSFNYISSPLFLTKSYHKIVIEK